MAVHFKVWANHNNEIVTSQTMYQRQQLTTLPTSIGEADLGMADIINH